MLKEFNGIMPDIHEHAYIAEGACVAGAVTMKEYSSLWHNVSVRGDVNRIEVGRYSNVQDNCVLHVADDDPCIIGDYVTVGHGAIVHACTVEEHCLIGMGAIIQNRAVIGKGSIVAAGSVVKEGTIVPPNSLVAGVPAKIVRTFADDSRLQEIHAQAVKYKSLWAERYGYLPDNDGEKYRGEKIV